MEERQEHDRCDARPDQYKSSCSRVDRLLKRADNTVHTNIRKALGISENAESLAKSIGYEYGVAASRLRQAYCYQQMFNNEQALRLLFETLPLFRDLQGAKEEANALKLIGDIHMRTGNLPDAIEYFYKSLRLALTLEDAIIAATIYTSLATAYIELEQFDEALTNLNQGLALFKGERYLAGEIACRAGISNALWNMQKYQEALENSRLTLAMAEDEGYTQVQISSLNIIGDVYCQLGDYERSQEYHESGLSLAQSLGDKYAETEALELLQVLSLKRGRYREALRLCALAEAVIRQTGSKRQLGNLYLRYSEVYEALNEMGSAFDYYKKFHALDKEVYDTEAKTTAKYLRLQLDFEKAQKDAEISQLRNVELAGLLDEREWFLKFAAHDLRTPVRTINNDVRTLNEKFHFMDNEKILEIGQRVERSSGLILDMIENLLDTGAQRETGQRLQAIDWGRNVRECIASFAKDAQAKNITLSQRVPRTVCMVRANNDALYRVAQNLISNAIKFSPLGSKVRITLSVGATSARLSVRDEGPGLTDEDKKLAFTKGVRLSALPTGGEMSTGLGLASVKQLIEELGGTVKVESKTGNGAKFIVALPLYPDADKAV